MKNASMKLLTICSFILPLAACAATGPVYNGQALANPAKGQTQLVIYRPLTSISSRGPMVEVNGRETCALPSNSFMITEIDPGTNTIAIAALGDLEKSSVTYNTKAGQRYYVKIYYNIEKARSEAVFGALGGLIASEAADSMAKDKGSFIVQAMGKKTAQQEIAGTKQSVDCK
jgi:hypothetical protein